MSVVVRTPGLRQIFGYLALVSSAAAYLVAWSVLLPFADGSGDVVGTLVCAIALCVGVGCAVRAIRR